MRIAVIGAGLIGSATAKYLGQAGYDTTVFGPTEPDHKPTHNGVFASHYDEGRITRQLDAHPFWATVSRASIHRYRDIEAASGIPFFQERGGVMVAEAGCDFLKKVAQVQKQLGLKADLLSRDALAERLPDYSFPDGFEGFHEPAGAGCISPRNLVKAQMRLAHAAGVTWVQEQVLDLDAGHGKVTTGSGMVQFDHVIVCAGGFAHTLLEMPERVTSYARTVALLEVSEQTAHRMAAVPPAITREPDGRDPYMLPPLKYPDGRYYAKLGGDMTDVSVAGLDELRAWFQGVGNLQVRDELAELMQRRLPKMNVIGITSASCVTTFTQSDLPLMARQSDRMTLAVAGCGRGAKCSDELGRLAALTPFAETPPITQVTGWGAV